MESDQIRMRLVERIERAFADVVYPGDDHLVKNPKELESMVLQKSFRGEHWTTISLPTLMDQRAGLPLLTPEAFVFFVPAYLHASVVYPDDVDVIPESIVSRLTPRAEPGDGEKWFRAVMAALTPAQKQTIRLFMEYWFEQIPAEFLTDKQRRAKEFWLESGEAIQ